MKKPDFIYLGMNKGMSPIRHLQKYGILEIGQDYKHVDGKPALRIDLYYPHGKPLIPVYESCHILDDNDQTPPTSQDPESPAYREYNGKCSACYLGINHSTALHDSRIG